MISHEWERLLQQSMELEQRAIEYADPSDEESIRAWKLLHEGNSNAIKQIDDSEANRKNRLVSIGMGVLKVVATVIVNIVTFKVVKELFFAEKDPDDPKVLLTTGEKNLSSELFRGHLFKSDI